MSIRRKWIALGRLPMVKQALFLLGCFMIVVSPLVGIIPGPGGVVVFAFGAGLVLKYSGWAKRRYVKFKKSHPNKGRWTDWSLRRESARRREAQLVQQAEGDPAAAAALEADRRTQRRLGIGITCLVVLALVLTGGFFAIGGRAGLAEAIGAARAQIEGARGAGGN
jgi:hypothetical protein